MVQACHAHVRLLSHMCDPSLMWPDSFSWVSVKVDYGLWTG